jgi:Pyruvate/2-oxoacid:ferredoxin oxidoreductase gamma subunit
LDAVGQALEGFYIYSAYGGDGPLDVSPFKLAVTMAPESFMAQDLYGWALYRSQDYKAARGAFLTSLRINPAGAGAMSGLMWCGVYGKDLEETMFWSGRKADICHQDIQAAREAGRRRYEKANK